MRPYRGVGSWVPVCPSREHGGARPRLRSSLWSVLPRQNDPVAASACVSGSTACLLVSGKPGVKTHTHEYGSISSGWPPNQPASRIAKLFGKGGLCGEVDRVREGALVVSSGAWKTFAPSKLAATPSLTRTDSVNQKSAMPPHACGGHQTQTLEMNTWPTIKRQHTRQSNSSA